MKIGILVSSTSRNAGGLLEAVSKLTLHTLQPPQYQVATFSLQDTNTQRDLAAWNNLEVFNFPTVPPHAFGYAPKLLGALLRRNIDIVHVHGIWMYPQLACWLWAKHQNKPYVVSPHGMLDPWAIKHSRWKKMPAELLYSNAQLKGAACIHALCISEAQSVRAYGLRNPICVIPNGIDLPAATTLGDPPWRSALPSESRVLFYLGRLHPKKGLSQLFHAWAAVRRSDRPADTWHLVIAGWDQDGHELELKKLAQQLGIQDSTHFIGPQFDAAKHACYRHADACVLPSFSEGLPMTILEAWSYALPVLMTPECNLPEGFSAGAALRIENSPESIAAGLSQLFSMDESERQAIGARGLDLVKRQFQWEKIAQDMRDVYAWILGQGPQPTCVMTD